MPLKCLLVPKLRYLVFLKTKVTIISVGEGRVTSVKDLE